LCSWQLFCRLSSWKESSTCTTGCPSFPSWLELPSLEQSLFTTQIKREIQTGLRLLSSVSFCCYQLNFLPAFNSL
jgi:hypothetical protein